MTRLTLLNILNHYVIITLLNQLLSLPSLHFIVLQLTQNSINRIKLDSVIFVVEINQIRQLGRSFYSFLSSDNQHVSEARHTALRLSIRIKCT